MSRPDSSATVSAPTAAIHEGIVPRSALEGVVPETTLEGVVPQPTGHGVVPTLPVEHVAHVVGVAGVEAIHEQLVRPDVGVRTGGRCKRVHLDVVRTVGRQREVQDCGVRRLGLRRRSLPGR